MTRFATFTLLLALASCATQEPEYRSPYEKALTHRPNSALNRLGAEQERARKRAEQREREERERQKRQNSKNP